MIDGLTRRQLAVLIAIASGMTNREIAEQMEISIKTVDTHRSHILRRLKLRNNSDMTRFAVRRGLVAAGSANDSLAERLALALGWSSELCSEDELVAGVVAACVAGKPDLQEVRSALAAVDAGCADVGGTAESAQ